ncbi:hypothetical protein [Streptomyces rugosispiralis]|uniref:Uncharacterized protein n=1 Tax=Streptomyces rugosispiralis TaxID=2967341 RepID=A0ABT1VB77_9ACTN|nr:hypothetical protein [Streptomyces rugosispiralis]MCQ8194648.1 hypothetical protein [Streptomyces rugosispiralis]
MDSMELSSIQFREGDDARFGGIDITISLTRDQAVAIPDVGLMADAVRAALDALATLRLGYVDQSPYNPDQPHADADADYWRSAIWALDRRLLSQLTGIRDAAVRAHIDSGGTVAETARAMDVARSTAQYRREALQATAPSTWETWATTPQH